MRNRKLYGDTPGIVFVVYAILSISSLLMFGPFLPVIATSLKSYSELMLRPFSIIPQKVLWRNYLEVFQTIPLLEYLWNTAKVSFLCTGGVLTTSSMAAYAFARLRFPGKNVLFVLYLATMMVPGQITLVPVFILMRNFRLIDTHASLILPIWGLMGAYGTFLLRQFFLTIPRDLEEAAILDGCGYLGRFCRIILPLSRPALATLGYFYPSLGVEQLPVSPCVFEHARKTNAHAWPCHVQRGRRRPVEPPYGRHHRFHSSYGCGIPCRSTLLR